MERSYRRPRISLGSWLSTLQTLLRGSCEVFWAMTLRSFLIKTLNCFWHRSSGFCRCIGNSWTVHDASDRVPRLKGLVAARGWSRSYVKKTRSRKERGSTMPVRLTRMIVVGFPNGLGHVASWVRFMSGFQSAGRRWLLRGFLVGLPLRGSPPTHRRVGPSQGLPIRLPKHLLGANIVRALLAPVSQWRILTALKWSTRSGNGHCQVLQWCQCSMWAVESSGWSWMIKLYWIAMECYRRCFRRNVLLLGKAHVVNGLQWASCCQAAKMRMTGSTSCYPRRTCGLPSQRGVLLRRKSQHRYSAKNGEGCRPSICGWWSI